MNTIEGWPWSQPIDTPREVNRTVIRLQTSFYSTKKGISARKDMIYLKKKCLGEPIAKEDILINCVKNLYNTADGIYKLIPHFEIGGDDVSYRLVPYVEKS